jgi:dihydroxyacetone kinase-like protein
MQITKYIQSIVDELSANEIHLNQLDAAIGDGDHGSNIVRGFKAILSQSNLFSDSSSLDKDLMVCAQQLMAKIGGSSGPLLGSGFMGLSFALKNKTTITKQDVVDALSKSFEKISQLGKSKVGEATMLDALFPAIEALKQANDLDFNKAYEAAQKGAEATIPMLATKGRASYLGQRSVGHMDPGACSIALIFKGLSKVNNTNDTQSSSYSKPSQNVSPQDSKSTTLTPINKLVNILIVSHSANLAKSVYEFVSEMKNGDFEFTYIGGIEGGKHFGTDPSVIKSTIERLTQSSELLLIYDMGSSKMNSEVAINMLDDSTKQRVYIANCAFLEGTLTAVVSNNTKNAKELKELVESQTKIIK